MKVYTYSAARAKLAAVLEESRSEEIIIKRRNGEMYVVAPRTAPPASPFDIPPSGLKAGVTADDIVGMVRESRERPYGSRAVSRRKKKSPRAPKTGS